VLSVTLVLLVVAAVAFAIPVTPKTGEFRGTTSQSTALGADYAELTVSKSGHAVQVTINKAVITCLVNPSQAPFELEEEISPKSFGGGSVPVKNGKFSYTGAVKNVFSSIGKGEISGTFKSPTKVVGSARFKWAEGVDLGPGLVGKPCDSGKLAFTATHR
jgi:hypothetical protein